MTVKIDPYTASNGQVIDATEINARFNELYTLQNGGIDGSNMDLTANFAWTGRHSIISTASTQVILTVTGNSLTTGSLASLTSNSTDTSTRNLVSIVNDNTAATGTTVLYLQQDALKRVLHLQYVGSSGGTAIADSTAVIESSRDNQYFQFLSADGKNQGILFGDASAAYRGQLQYDHATDKMALHTAGAETFAIGSTGAIGIVSGQAFYVDGVARTGNTYFLESSADVFDLYVGGSNVAKFKSATTGLTLTTTTFTPLAIVRSDTGGIFGDIQVVSGGNTRYFIGTDASDNFSILNGDGTVAMSVATSGSTSVATFTSSVAATKFSPSTSSGTSTNKGQLFKNTCVDAWGYIRVNTTTVTVERTANITSVTRISAGIYEVTMSITASDANYCIVGNCTQDEGTRVDIILVPDRTTKTTTVFRVWTVGAAVGPVDGASFYFAVIGAQS